MAQMKPKDKSKVRVLIADPHATSRNVISIMLHKFGYGIIKEAVSCKEADQVFAENTKGNSGMSGLLGGATPSEICELDLVIIDSNLDNGAGLRYLLSLRHKFKQEDLKILFTVMKGNEAILVTAIKSGANETIVKPFSSSQFKIMTDYLLAGGRKPATPEYLQEKQAKPVNVPVSNTMSMDSSFERANRSQASIAPPPGSVPLEKSEKTNKGAGGAGGGRASFYRGDKAVTYSTEDGETASLTDGKIDGHYHEKVDVIGGGQNCYWAREIGDGKVQLEYLSAKGKATGMVAKLVEKERFMHTFYLCDEHGCAILDRLSNK